jgi:hypothetical protein
MDLIAVFLSNGSGGDDIRRQASGTQDQIPVHAIGRIASK